MEEKRSLNYFLQKAENIANTFVMAINGAFFTVRKPGQAPTASQIENAKLNVAQARYAYIDGINSLLGEIELNVDGLTFSAFEQAYKHLISIAIELTHQANRAISTGHQSKAAAMLGKNAHGAMGLLVQKKLAQVELVATDMSGQKWREPQHLVKLIVQRLAQPMEN